MQGLQKPTATLQPHTALSPSRSRFDNASAATALLFFLLLALNSLHIPWVTGILQENTWHFREEPSLVLNQHQRVVAVNFGIKRICLAFDPAGELQNGAPL